MHDGMQAAIIIELDSTLGQVSNATPTAGIYYLVQITSSDVLSIFSD